MFKLNNWKNPIYKEDVIQVLLNGILFGILGGMLGGVLNYLMYYVLNSYISFGVVICAYLIAYRTARVYHNYHPLYSILGFLFMYIGFLFMKASTYFIYVYLYNGIGNLGIAVEMTFASGWFYLEVLISPILNIISAIGTADVWNYLFAIMNLICYIWAYGFCIRMIRGRN